MKLSLGKWDFLLRWAPGRLHLRAPPASPRALGPHHDPAPQASSDPPARPLLLATEAPVCCPSAARPAPRPRSRVPASASLSQTELLVLGISFSLVLAPTTSVTILDLSSRLSALPPQLARGLCGNRRPCPSQLPSHRDPRAHAWHVELAPHIWQMSA